MEHCPESQATLPPSQEPSRQKRRLPANTSLLLGLASQLMLLLVPLGMWKLPFEGVGEFQ